MSISRIKQIKRILTNGDVRDPRAILIAIEDVLSQPKQKKSADVDQIMSFNMVATPTGSAVGIKFNEKRISARHVLAAKQVLDEFAKEKFPECGGNCETCETTEGAGVLSAETAERLSAMFANMRKGGLQ